jgi:hypothetical protein
VWEASGEWRMLVERCYHALDLSRIQFRDVDHRCPLATTNVAVVQVAVGICLLAALELAAEAVIVTGVVVVAAAIAAELTKEEEAARDQCTFLYVQCKQRGWRSTQGWNCYECLRNCQGQKEWPFHLCGPSIR